MVVVVCEERKTIKNIFFIFNEIEFRIYNLMWVFLKSGYE